MFTPEMEASLARDIEAFHAAHPDIHVTTERFLGHQDEASRRLELKLALDEQPDLAWLPPPYTGDLAQAGALRPVASFIAQDTMFDADDFYPWGWKDASYNGTRYALPYEVNTIAVLYNKRLFRAAGLTRPPQTWTELRSAARRLTVDRDNDGTPEQCGLLLPLGASEWAVWTWETFLWQAGGQLLTDDLQAPAFDRPAGEEALQFWVDLVHKDDAACLSEVDMGWDVTPFINGEVAIQITGPWDLPRLQRADSLDFGVFPLPRNRKRATNIGGENLYILKTTPEREAASWTLAKYLVRPDVQRRRLETTQQFPTRRSVVASDWMAEYLRARPALRVFFDALEYGQTRPSIPEYFSISRALGDGLTQALQKEKLPNAALEDAARKAHAILQQERTQRP